MRLDSCGLWAAVAALGMGCTDAGADANAVQRLQEEPPAQRTPATAEPAESDTSPELSPTVGLENEALHATLAHDTPSEGAPSQSAPPPSAAAPDAPAPKPAAKVEIEITRAVDDFVYASVDGIRKKVWYIGDPDQLRRIDVTSWFGAGQHALRLQAINTVGPTSFGVRVWVDGVVALEAPCAAALCGGNDAPRGIIFDQTLALSTLGPPWQAVNVTSAAPGKLYVDDAFTGLSTTGSTEPVRLSLPPGEHTIGLGVSDDSPPEYSGSYFERSVTLSEAALNVEFTAEEAPLPVQQRTRVALVPIRSFVVDSFAADQVGVLADEQVDTFFALGRATRDEWLEPFSYGLVSWDLDVVPVVERAALHAATHDAVPDADAFLREAGLQRLRDDYDLIVLHYSYFAADGSVLRGEENGVPVEAAGVALGGGGVVWFPTGFVDIYGEATGPNPALLHEALHNYEGYNERGLHFYLGADGLHGGDEHGYYSGDGGEVDFALWQRLYMRNQIAEVSAMRVDVPAASPAPQADLWVGVFDTLRRGYAPGF